MSDETVQPLVQSRAGNEISLRGAREGAMRSIFVQVLHFRNGSQDSVGGTGKDFGLVLSRLRSRERDSRVNG
jgi:hypothetical protein